MELGEPLEHKFTEPTPQNVENGDFLVGEDKKRNIRIGPITSIYIYGTGLLTAQIGDKINNSVYANAIVLKKDGTYLVGKEISKQLAGPEKSKGGGGEPITAAL